ncbi:MAG: histidine kinase [Alphaproteobacteria bacterium]|nr:histidine kinase [Alphaproteobacteria bacterium]
MTTRQWIAAVSAAIALGGYLASTLVVRWSLLAAGIDDEALLTGGTVKAGAAGLALALALLGLFLLVDRWLIAPAEALGRQVRRQAQSKLGEHPVEVPQGHRLGPLPQAVVALTDQLRLARRDMVRAMETATAEVARQKEWLEAILLDFSDGVVVCDPQHRVLLYNQAAVRLLPSVQALGLGRPLFSCLTREPILHALERLEYRRAEGGGAAELVAPFVCATMDASTMLHGRMALILGPVREVDGYAITLTDIRSEIAGLTRMTNLRRALGYGLRGPAASLRAAAETLAGFPDMEAVQRRAFEQVIVAEATEIARQIDTLSGEYRGHELLRWPMGDIHSADLAACVGRALAEDGPATLTLVGIPQWLRGDSFSLLLLLKTVLGHVHRLNGATAFDLETRTTERQVYVDVSWTGPAVPSAVIESWQDDQLDAVHTGLTIRDVLERHGTDLWCLDQAGGRALLRLPLPLPAAEPLKGPSRPLPPRPEFYDFSPVTRSEAPASIADRRLRDLDYVVFDTETTGLRPTDGDEIISLAGVRVVNQRILSAERFERLVNPKRKIPRGSIRFHGITDDMVADKPPIEVVLPQFKAFVGDAVLVAHNAAFDLKFLRMKEAASQVSFSNPAIDTLLLSVLIDREEESHSLDSVLDRFSIPAPNRHTALGDALATAELFIRLVDRLDSIGIRTLRESMSASNMAAEMRQVQKHF